MNWLAAIAIIGSFWLNAILALLVLGSFRYSRKLEQERDQARVLLDEAVAELRNRYQVVLDDARNPNSKRFAHLLKDWPAAGGLH